MNLHFYVNILILIFSLYSCTTGNKEKVSNIHEYYVVSYDCDLEESCYKLEKGNEHHVAITQPELQGQAGLGSATAFLTPPDSIGTYVLYIDGKKREEFIVGEKIKKNRCYSIHNDKVLVEWVDSVGFKTTSHFDPQSGVLSKRTIQDPHGNSETYYYYEDGNLMSESRNGNRKSYYANGDLKSEAIGYGQLAGIVFNYDPSGRANERQFWLYRGTVGRTEMLDENGVIKDVDMEDAFYQDSMTVMNFDTIARFDNDRRHGWNTFGFSKGKLEIKYDHDELKAWRMEIWRDQTDHLLKDTLRYKEEY